MRRSVSERDKWRKFWDEQAKVGDLHQAVRGEKVFSDEVQAFHDQKMIELLSPSPTDHILDAGCGLGDQTILLSSRVSRITAVDYSPPMVERCQKRLKQQRITNAEVRIADVTQLPFSDNHFDGAISICVLQYLNEDEVLQMFSEIKRVVKEGSIVVYHFKNTLSPAGVMIKVGRFLRALIKGRPPLEYHYRSQWWYKKRAKQFGEIVGRYSYGIWTPFMPKKMIALIAYLETKLFPLSFLQPFGKEYFLKIKISKNSE